MGDDVERAAVVVAAQRVVELGLAGDDVEAVGVPAAAHRDVSPFAIEGVRAEHERLVDGDALGLVAGERVGVVERRSAALGGALEVFGGEGDLAAASAR